MDLKRESNSQVIKQRQKSQIFWNLTNELIIRELKSL